MTIRGTVIRVGSPGLICKSMAFECSSCRGTQALIQPQGVYTGTVYYIRLFVCSVNLLQGQYYKSFDLNCLLNTFKNISFELLLNFFIVPASCPSCRAFGKFEALQSSPFTITVDFQVAKVQETQAQVILNVCIFLFHKM